MFKGLATSYFIFRHGETSWNEEGRLQGHIDISLTATGRRQALSLIPILREKKIEAILTSDLLRAKETAEIIAASLKVPVIANAKLREVFLGEAQGMLVCDIDEKFGEGAWDKWQSSEPEFDEFSLPGAESKADVHDRIYKLLTNFALANDCRNIGVCTHGFVMSRLAIYAGLDSKKTVKNGDLMQLVLKNDRK